MSDYNWQNFRRSGVSERFPEWATGSADWASQSLDLETSAFHYKGDKPWLPEKPRLFISYKSEDRAFAIEVSNIARSRGFYVWLDVLDPDLRTLSGSRPSSAHRSRLIAGIIEMALLNCSHVVAVMTENTRRSWWVPYEYGRVKDDDVLSSEACAFLAAISRKEVPGYMHLGAICEEEADLESWLEEQADSWPAKYEDWLAGEVLSLIEEHYSSGNG